MANSRTAEENEEQGLENYISLVRNNGAWPVALLEAYRNTDTEKHVHRQVARKKICETLPRITI